MILTFEFKQIPSAPVIKTMTDHAHLISTLWPSVYSNKIWQRGIFPHAIKYSNGSSKSCSMCGMCTSLHAVSLPVTSLCACENASKESGWICKHMCNEGYLVNQGLFILCAILLMSTWPGWPAPTGFQCISRAGTTHRHKHTLMHKHKYTMAGYPS